MDYKILIHDNLWSMFLKSPAKDLNKADRRYKELNIHNVTGVYLEQKNVFNLIYFNIKTIHYELFDTTLFRSFEFTFTYVDSQQVNDLRKY